MSSRIFFYLPVDHRPSGGMRQAYRQVEVLRQIGREAYIVHAADGFRYPFASCDVPVVPVSSLSLTGEDAVVLPEIIQSIPAISGMDSAIKVVSVQNQFLLTKAFCRIDADINYLYRDFASYLLTSSQEGLEALLWLFPKKRSMRFWYSFDREPFLYHGEQKQRKFCFMPRKRSEEISEVFSFLRIAGIPSGWTEVKIDGKSEQQTAEIMRESVLFLSFSDKEGFGMPPCFLPEQRVWTENGSIPIESVETGNLVVTHTGEIKPVVTPMVRNVKDEEIIVMKLMGLYCHQQLTKEHPVFSLITAGRRTDLIRRSMRRGEKPDWRLSASLSVDDYVVIPKMKFLTAWRKVNLSTYGYRKSKFTNHGSRSVSSAQISEATGVRRGVVQRILCGNDIDNIKKDTTDAVWLCANKLGWSKAINPSPLVLLNEDFGFFIGQYIAEGSCSENGAIEFASHALESDIRDELLRIASSIFGLQGERDIKGNGGRVWICCKPLSIALKNLCGKGAYNKILPMRLMIHNKKFARGVIRGAWLGDGSVKSYSMMWSYTTMSSKLAHDMRQALTLFGILPSIGKSDDEYVLKISGRGRLLLADLLRLPAEKHPRSGQGYIDSEYGFLVPIREIHRVNYSGPVYNMEVTDESSYCVEGMASHNCEAMACGCVVVGYHGIGGREFFGKDFCVTIEENDSVQYARTLLSVMSKSQEDFIALGKRASEWVTSEYSTEKEISSLKSIWNEIMTHKTDVVEHPRVKVVILHHNKPENADRLFVELSRAFNDVEIWDSGSDPKKIPKYLTRSFGNIYWTGAWNEAMRTCSDYDVVWLVGDDIELRNNPEEYRKAIEASYPFGVWSPCIDGRAHPFMLTKHYTDGKRRSVKNIEGMALACSGALIREVKQLIPGSPIGFGQDYWLCYRARKVGMNNYIDGSVSVFHPEPIRYNETLAHDQMEEAFSETYGKDFRRTIFEYSSAFDGNLVASVNESNSPVNTLMPSLSSGETASRETKEEKKEKGMLTIFTIDNGWGLADFMEITKQFPEVKKVLMRKGVSPLSDVQGIDVITYNTDLSVFDTDEHIAFFPRVGPANFEDFKKIVALGIPTVANIAYHRDVIVHEKNGFLYQDKTWAGQWLRTLLIKKKLRQSIREKSKQMNVDKLAGISQSSPASEQVPAQSSPPIVTVITPTFRREPKIVRRSCFSLQLQTLMDWEQLVCSDGADETPIRDLVTSLADPRIQYRHTATKKTGDFGNTVRSEMLKAARGKYVIFMDDDNVILPDYLEKMVKAVETSGADFAVCRVVHFGPLNESVVGKPPKVLTGFPVKLFHIDSLQVLVKREVMLAVGWDTEKGYTSDGVTLEALGAKYKSVEVTEVLGFHL